MNCACGHDQYRHQMGNLGGFLHCVDCGCPKFVVEKIRVKGSAKLFKSGPKKSGRERLEAKARKLHVEAHRWAQKGLTDEDRRWCEQLAHGLQIGLTPNA